jgi:hypothetical protein
MANNNKSTIIMVKNACYANQITVTAEGVRQTVQVVIKETISVFLIFKITAVTKCTKALVIKIPAA